MTTLVKYRRTEKGLVRNIFSHIKERCSKYNRELGFSSDELLAWCIPQKRFHDLFYEWVNSGYLLRTKPSIDRIDPLRGYTFDNIQLTTYMENRMKGDKEKEILWGKPIIQCDLSGVHIQRFNSIKQAVKQLNLNQGLVSAVLLGYRNHTGGFKFIYENPELLNP